MMVTDFRHRQLAHCENGAISNLLYFNGLEISEAMIFGIGSGLFFAYLPIIRNHTIPLTSFRIWPGKIQRNVTERLGIKFIKKTYRNRHKAMEELDEMLRKGRPVGLLTNLYYLPYFPRSYRFHFNQHNLVVYGKEDDTYLVSDPVLENSTRISRDDLLTARFARGVLSVEGDMYFPGTIPDKIPWKKAIIKGINATCLRMARNPIPYHGSRGINLLARRIRKERQKNSLEFLNLFLGNIIRMQEEAGTGGSGFRYMYAAFLQETARRFKNDDLIPLSVDMTDIGNRWRDFAVCAGRIIKSRIEPGQGFAEIDHILRELAERERVLFRKLDTIILK